MKIAKYRLARLRVPLVTPFRTALRTVESLETLILEIHTDCGLIGYGEASPTKAVTGETMGSIEKAITTQIMPAIQATNIEEPANFSAAIANAVRGNSSARSAVEVALYDIWAQSANLPLYKALGGGANHLKTDITISLNDPAKMAADTRLALAKGFETLKIKVGKDAVEDIDRIRAVHTVAAGQAALILDVNQGWTAEKTVDAIQALEKEAIHLALVEQPVPAADIGGLQYVRDRIEPLVMADESVFTPADAGRVAQAKAADVLNIKLMKTGGITDALAVAEIAMKHDLTCMMGCMLESPVSVTAAAHVAAARQDVVRWIDLDGPSLIQSNPVTSGTRFEGPDIFLSDRPGLGIQHIEGLEYLDSRS